MTYFFCINSYESDSTLMSFNLSRCLHDFSFKTSEINVRIRFWSLNGRKIEFLQAFFLEFFEYKICFCQAFKFFNSFWSSIDTTLTKISISFQIKWNMIVVMVVLLSILNQIHFHLVQNWKENYHNDLISFNLRGNGDLFLHILIYCIYWYIAFTDIYWFCIYWFVSWSYHKAIPTATFRCFLQDCKFLKWP